MHIRLAKGEEIELAVRMALGGASSTMMEEQVRDLSRGARSAGDAPGAAWIAVSGQNLESAALPLVSPGKTVLLFIPPSQVEPRRRAASVAVLQAACRHAAAAGVHLAQVLADPADTDAHFVLAQAGFQRLAELIYLQAQAARNMPRPDFAAPLSLRTYSASSAPDFARAILQAYEESLDCPALNGVRDINDILAGHRATGLFDPKTWFLLCDNQAPVAVMLLSAVARGSVMELVYLGVAPHARGKGLGERLMQLAEHVASQSGCSLSLAVDAANLPALRLYWRHGLKAVHRRLAMILDLRTLAPQPAAPRAGPAPQNGPDGA